MKKIMIFAAALAIMTSAAEAKSAIPYVKQAARHYGVPVSTAIKVCMVESRCRWNVRRGRHGEIGPMQVLPRTARGIRMSLKGCKNQVYAGVKYLRMALRSGGVWKYNQGTGAKRKSRAGAKYERMVRNARTR